MEDFISFKEIYHHIALAIAIVLGATWSDAIKAKLMDYAIFSRTNGVLLQSVIVTVSLLSILMGCYLVLFSLQKEEDDIDSN